jgi:hypothetical protein
MCTPPPSSRPPKGAGSSFPRIRSNRASDERAPRPSDAAQSDNNLGTDLRDTCQAPQGPSGRFNAHVEEGHKDA